MLPSLGLLSPFLLHCDRTEMVKNCIVGGCKATENTPGISFFRFPTRKGSESRRRAWVRFVKSTRKDFTGVGIGLSHTLHSRICSQHFHASEFAEGIRILPEFFKRKLLKETAIPTIRTKHTGRKERRSSQLRERRKEVAQILLESEEKNRNVKTESASEKLQHFARLVSSSVQHQQGSELVPNGPQATKALNAVKKMDGKQHLTPTSSNTGQPEGKHYLNDSKGTRTQSHEHLRGQTKDDIQIREGQGLNVLRNSEPGRYSEVMNTSKDKEGQLESKGVVGKPADGAQIVIPQTASGSSAASEQSIQGTGSAPLHPELLSNDANSILQRSVSVDGETQLNQAAIKLLQRLEFKNPGRKQIEYGTFNPEESEREKKKLRRFQTSKPRTGACYKEDGILLDGRDLCDCLTETCPGCFYPCPQCSSPKCGPTCRNNRRWVYDYIEDEGRTYKIEFPEAENLAT